MVSVSFPVNCVFKLHVYHSILVKIKLFIMKIDIPEKNSVGHYARTILALLAQMSISRVGLGDCSCIVTYIVTHFQNIGIKILNHFVLILIKIGPIGLILYCRNGRHNFFQNMNIQNKQFYFYKNRMIHM